MADIAQVPQHQLAKQSPHWYQKQVTENLTHTSLNYNYKDQRCVGFRYGLTRTLVLFLYFLCSLFLPVFTFFRLAALMATKRLQQRHAAGTHVCHTVWNEMCGLCIDWIIPPLIY